MKPEEIKLLNQDIIAIRQDVLGKYVLGEELSATEKPHLWYALLVVANIVHQSKFSGQQRKQSMSAMVDRVMNVTDFIQFIREKIKGKDLTPRKAYAYLLVSYRKEYHNCLGKQEMTKHYSMGYDLSLVRQYVLFKRCLNVIRKQGLPFTRTSLLSTLLEVSPVKTNRGRQFRELQVDMWISTFINHTYLEEIACELSEV